MKRTNSKELLLKLQTAIDELSSKMQDDKKEELVKTIEVSKKSRKKQIQ